MSYPISGTEPCHIGYPVAPGLTDADRAGPKPHVASRCRQCRYCREICGDGHGPAFSLPSPLLLPPFLPPPPAAPRRCPFAGGRGSGSGGLGSAGAVVGVGPAGAGREGRGAVAGVDGPDAEHRHLRAHRLREDDADRAGPLLHRPDPRDPRGSRARRYWHQDGFHGPRARKGNHHPVRCHLLHLEWVPGPFVLLHPLLI